MLNRLVNVHASQSVYSVQTMCYYFGMLSCTIMHWAAIVKQSWSCKFDTNSSVKQSMRLPYGCR